MKLFSVIVALVSFSAAQKGLGAKDTLSAESVVMNSTHGESSLGEAPSELKNSTDENTPVKSKKKVEAKPASVDAYPVNRVSGCGGNVVLPVSEVGGYSETPTFDPTREAGDFNTETYAYTESDAARKIPYVPCSLTSNNAYPEKINDPRSPKNSSSKP
ncbi:hypothetical protein DSO57_1030586 [Entomophthora muscae]|uniref:Uncharacterized protein n=1 Tax=Entomophthora muscae TaxID=34485 RepID=A0ACC2TML7_9FUNG|nr:hypothetical protein DSO57_1030586 [Entomophthora muscae]